MTRVCQRHPDRCGYTLVEMMIVITAVGMLGVMGAVLIGLLMSATNRGTEAAVVQTTFSRLGWQWRSDVHAAAAANVESVEGREGARVVLQPADGPAVTYSGFSGSVLRESGEGADRSRQEYLLPEGTTRFAVDEAGVLVSLLHERPHELPQDTGAEGLQELPARTLTHEARLNWDARHAGAAPGEGGE
jgi:prepilin-type N-terminal cleavage/methylation domain-containing protein